jgi:hypothetical protein
MQPLAQWQSLQVSCYIGVTRMVFILLNDLDLYSEVSSHSRQGLAMQKK